MLSNFNFASLVLQIHHDHSAGLGLVVLSNICSVSIYWKSNVRLTSRVYRLDWVQRHRGDTTKIAGPGPILCTLCLKNPSFFLQSSQVKEIRAFGKDQHFGFLCTAEFPPLLRHWQQQPAAEGCPVNYHGTRARYARNMAAMRTLTVAGLFLAFCAMGLIAIAISTDNWYETDARRHRERCKNYSNKRNDPGYIYISNNNLPLRMLPKEKNVERKGSSVSGEMLLRAKRHFLPPAPAMESLCSRQFNSTITGLWRKCHREGFDLETEDLIFKGLIGWHVSCTVSVSQALCVSGLCAIQGADAAHGAARPTQYHTGVQLHHGRLAVLFCSTKGQAVVTESSRCVQ